MADQITLKDPYAEKRLFMHRVLTAVGIIALLVFLLLARYFSLQITQHEVYRTQSERNRVQLQPIAPKRGLIYDRNGVLLAENIPTYSLTIVSERVGDLDHTIELLGQLVSLDQESIEKFRQRLKRRRPFEAVPIRFRLSEDEIATIAVNRHRLPGVDVDAELSRYYPHGELFAHVLGYVGRISEEEQFQIDPVNYSGTHSIGKIGLEKFYEDMLHGEVGYQNVETNARGRVLRVLERTDPRPGQDLFLHLDVNLQRAAHDALAGERGAVVAIDPASGGVLAMVSTPGYDPNLFVNGISASDFNALRESIDLPLFDRTLQGQYPPGSTVKPIYGLAGLEYGVVTVDTAVRDPGWYQLPNDERFYRDWKREGHGAWVNLEQAIVESCDVYYYDLAFRLGIDRIHEFTTRFGLGRTTGIDNTNERSGLLPSREWKRQIKRLPWFPGETLNVGIGQGYMLTTPLQLAVSTAFIASRGQRFEPRLLRQVGTELVVAPVLPALDDVSAEHWRVIISAMENVVHGSRGTARRIGLDSPYRIAGKTGTAQVIGIPQGEEYDAEQIAKRKRDHALFVGFAPADNPRIAVAVIVENGESGSGTAAPVARKVFDQYLLGQAQLSVEPAAASTGE